MTITKYDRIAIIPRRCECCNRLFIFEPYNFHYRYVFVTGASIKYIKCKRCEIKAAECKGAEMESE